jgi:DNA-binding MarR family transcriptional regulator
MPDYLEATRMAAKVQDAAGGPVALVVASAAGVVPADLGILLTVSLRGFVDLLHGELGRKGFADVRPPFGVVFRSLRDGPLTLTDLAARLGVTKQAVAKVVSEMAGKGLLRRRPDARDSRAKLLELTPRGRRAMSTAIGIGADIERRLREQVGDGPVDGLTQTLTAFVELAGGSAELAARRSRAVW